MKFTIANLIDPACRINRSLGSSALVLQALMAPARRFRDTGRWGSSGPGEILNGYNGCVNAHLHPWHTSRNRLTTHRSHVDNILSCILSALCSDQAACRLWRKAQSILLESEFTFRSPGDEFSRADEVKAFEGFMALHGHRLPHSLNSCHRDVKVLCFPELNIGRAGITLEVQATSATELRVSKESASRWAVSFLAETAPPAWKWQRETFAEFLLRATAYYREVAPASAIAA